MTGLALVLALSTQVVQVTKSEQCMECHETEHKKEWTGSVHHANRIACMDCHGADKVSTNPEVLDPHTDEFTGRIDKKRVTALCAKCHSTEAEEFLGGNHGEGKVRNCLSCHENHKTREASFEVLQKNCRRCHTEESAGLKGLEAILIFEGGIRRVREEGDKLEKALREFLLQPGLTDREAKKVKEATLRYWAS